MFKKPKKNPKAKFRSIKRSIDEEDDHDDDQTKRTTEGNHETAFNNKRARVVVNDREQDSPVGNDTNDADHSLFDNDSINQQHDQDDGDSTFLLLQQAKMEQRQKNAKRLPFHAGGSRPNTKSHTTTNKTLSIHQQYVYKASNPLSDKDLATRTAEYHPVTEEKNTTTDREDYKSNKKHDTEHPSRQKDAEGDNVVLYKGNKEPRNKFLAGPLKAPTFVRTTSRFDYQPDICKDYKDTGFCGFGDSCIYLHDRGNTLTGWQLEEQYEKMKKLQQDKKMREMDRFCQEIMSGSSGSGGVGGGGGTIDHDEHAGGPEQDRQDDLPFACYLCRKPFTDPVVTSCNHYFCQKCIMQYVQDHQGKSGGTNSGSSGMSSACPICHRDTHGVFNYPTKLHQKKRRMECSSWEEFAKKNSGQT